MRMSEHEHEQQQRGRWDKKKFIHKNSPFNPLTERERGRRRILKISTSFIDYIEGLRIYANEGSPLISLSRKSLIGNVQNSLAIQMRQVPPQ